jgi:hypothetical protein
MKDTPSEDVKQLRENLQILLQAEVEEHLQQQEVAKVAEAAKAAEPLPWPWIVMWLIVLAYAGYATIVQYHQGYFDYARYCLASFLLILLAYSTHLAALFRRPRCLARTDKTGLLAEPCLSRRVLLGSLSFSGLEWAPTY